MVAQYVFVEQGRLEHSKVTYKDNHSVFSVPKDQVLGLLDEAWARKSPAFNDNGLDVRIVDMGKVIGTHGERSVRMATRPGTAEIVSAYPVK
ncbi:hypothetical protein DSM101010T_34840 [Desulfovibrio subterraneus]|uniref:Uncharacterized protein n=1 Tax=Desulfovibrio subterraneus TaxID=2718620 RepID=A0A7J0BN84_9BACT|nr:hypothetical protein DSM101010T_34840 [Desulfovibrio subterraneus]